MTFKPKLLLGFDNRNSFIGDTKVKVIGLRIGKEYNERFRMAIGFYNTTDVITEQKITQNNSKNDTIVSKVGLGYLSFTADYVFYYTRKWELSVPIQLGLGSGRRTQLINDSLLKDKTQSKVIMPIEIGVSAVYKIRPWVGVGAGLGSRFSLLNTSEFNGPFYSIGIKIYFGVLYRKVFPKKK